MTDFMKALSETPISVLLVIAGIIFLLLGIATFKKPIVIDVPPSGRKAALVIGIFLLFIGLYITFWQVKLNSEATPALTETPTSTETPISNEVQVVNEVPSETITPAVNSVYFSEEIIHLGDNKFDDWEKLTGECFPANIVLTLPMQEVSLSLSFWNLDTPIYLKINKVEVSMMPYISGVPVNQWSPEQSVYLPTHYFTNGLNTIEICSSPLIYDQGFPGELDDSQIRNIQISVKY
jgi:hypothetical protein